MTFGKYELLESIGAGTIAEVFKAKSFGAEGFEKRLVIKRIAREFSEDDTFGELFVEDTKNAVLLNHANIVQVFDLGKVDETFFLAMELIQGLSLYRILSDCKRQGKQLPLELAAFVASEIAKGLDFAHRKRGRDLKPLNMVHRDISAHNIMISVEGEIKIADFGLARAKEAVAKQIKIKRHPLYLSPEQARREEPDKRSDIFCVGMLLYEMITLRHPFKGVGRISITERAKKREYLTMRKLRPTPEIPDTLVDIVDKALSSNPDERYENAGALYEELIAFIYQSKSRVGTHNVADFLSEIIAENPSRGDFRPPKEKTLEAAFLTSLAPEPEAPEEKLSSTPPDEVAAMADSALPTAPEVMLGDVTLLVMDFRNAGLDEFKMEPFSEIVENNGGVLVSTDEKHAVAVFGLDLTYGKEAEEALGAAFKLRRAATVQHQESGEQLVISVWPSKIPLTGDETYLKHEIYIAAVERAKTAASLAAEGIVTSKKGSRLSSSAYHFDKLDVVWPGDQPGEVYQVIGRLSLMERRGRLFGRHEQLQTIGRVFTAASTGHGACLLVDGPKGVGKTRLVREGQWRLLSSGGDVGWYETQCCHWNSEVPFSGLADMFRAVLALDLVTPEGEVEEKVSRLKELSLTDEEMGAVSALLGLGTDEGSVFYDAGRIFYSAMVHVLSGLCADRMTVFVWDNADDLDKDTLAVITKLSASFEGLPFVAILIYRSIDPDEWLEDSVVQRLSLSSFLENDANRFVLSCIGAERAPNALLSKVYSATDGNPLLTETYLADPSVKGCFSIRLGKATLTEGASLPIEVSLIDLLKKQISSLSSAERAILEAAAVIGHRFNTKVLGRMVDTNFVELKSAVIRLKKKHLLFRVSVSEFCFSSKALFETVRSGIRVDVRRGHHLKLSEAMLGLFENRVEYMDARLAIHFEMGGDPIRAIEHFTRAGKKAAEGHAHRAALNFYIRAQELLRNLPGPDPDGLVAICVPIGELAIKANAYELGLKKIQLAEWVSEQVTDKQTLVRVLLLTSELHAHCEHNVEVDWYMEWAMDLSQNLHDNELSFEVLESAGHVYFLLGDMKKAAPMFRQAIELASEQTDRDRLISCMAKLSKVEASAGELEQAMKTLSSAEQLIEETSDLLTLCEIEQSRGRAFFMAGNTEKAIDSQLKLLEIAKEYGLKEYIADTAYLTGQLYLESGENAKAFAYLNMSKDTAMGIGLKNLINIDNLLLNYIDAIEIGGGNQIEDLEKALLDALERDAVWEQLHLLYYLSKIYIEKGLKKLAREHLVQLIKLGATLNNRLYYTKAEELLKEIDALESIIPR